MWPNPQFPANLVTFTEKTLMKNFTFCAVCVDWLSLHTSDIINMRIYVCLDSVTGSVWMIYLFYRGKLVKQRLDFQSKIVEKKNVWLETY